MDNYLANLKMKCFAFNIWDINSAREIINAASSLNMPVIIQTSSAVFKRVEPLEFRAYVKKYAQKRNAKVFLHLDHCKEMEEIRHAIYSGWDSVMIDASSSSLEENILLTQEVCSIAHNNGVAVEGEVGQIRGIEDELNICEQGIARLEDIKKYVDNTEVDFIAAAIGNAHGRYKCAPHIHFELLESIMQMIDLPFVVHGGSGLSDEILLKLLAYDNVKKINISTEVKEAYFKGLKTLEGSKYFMIEGFNPLKINDIVYSPIREMALEKMSLILRQRK